jgi:hypothetical protein
MTESDGGTDSNSICNRDRKMERLTMPQKIESGERTRCSRKNGARGSSATRIYYKENVRNSILLYSMVAVGIGIIISPLLVQGNKTTHFYICTVILSKDERDSKV